ncbi:polyphenol oxidase, chloroplastic-like [Olea europaea var. sylvestris]|uniref:polyphenol oxidase, chloroplastic-like n=1 Tax=Olea europaea var. sylvestris TaxID=158386 RepID=UPI000C1D5301|nr:polyphenol oxidase, chloroplastic-like [Olea europaea var. sylvestris]
MDLAENQVSDMECVSKFVTFNAITFGILLPIGCKYADIVEMIYSKLKLDRMASIYRIEVDTATFVTFDVFAHDKDDDPYVFDMVEYAGCFSQVPHKNSSRVKTKIRWGLTELSEDLDCLNDEYILITSVPKVGGEGITIGGIKIIYVS